ncbi:39S ribosomal protein L35, mitochondrial [Aedes aegypti]|uniref:50S ribosomal protein L35 n=1 Tax=Aedes aegypti TaxID=7159 RepID=A0A0P6IVN7_AEDAE|nr:39S ribosomal protein L35, mitochondrial [Aedes aegypti]
MLRAIVCIAARNLTRPSCVSRLAATPKPIDSLSDLTRSFSTLLRIGNAPGQLRTPFTVTAQNPKPSISNPVAVQLPQPNRTVIKFSMRSGKRKSVKPVMKRFKRLDWGGWIRTKAGRHKHMWKKSAGRKRRLRQHVLVNSQQATLLDKMVTKYWKRPRHYINDPYTPYHTREEFRETRRKPVKY